MIGNQNRSIVPDRFHSLRVGDHIRRNIALVKTHAFHHFFLEPHGLPFLDRDDAVVADLVHGFRDKFAYFRIKRSNRRHLGDFFASFDVFLHMPKRPNRVFDRISDSLAEPHRIVFDLAISKPLHPLVNHFLREYGRSRGAVSRLVVGFVRHFLD